MKPERRTFIEWAKEEVPEPRVASLVTYPLTEILFVVFVGVLCGMEDIDEIALFARMNLEWFRRLIAFENGTAPAQTIRRVLRALDHRAFECSFTSWASEWSGGGVVAIDGKSLRGTSEGQPHDAVHTISAFAHTNGLVLGQRCVDSKSNEITAIPTLLEQLFLDGAIVTIDAMGTQTKIARAIRDKGADYVLALKGNQSRLHDDVARYFADAALAKTCPTHATTDCGHGRIDERCIRVTGAIGWLKDLHPNWADLRCIIAVTSVRTDKKSGATSKETRFYITSLPPDPERILAAIRAHWGIENTLHWSLDVTFGEDSSRLRKDNAAANMAVIRKAAFNALKRLSSKLSLKLRRVQASLDPAYRSALISS